MNGSGSRAFDTLHMGRSSIDLYSNDIGAPFEEIASFAAYVGGSPTNISVGLSRLGAKTALLTAFGDDPVADFILRFLRENRVDASFSPRKPGRRTSAVLLGIEPPDRFPLVFYRDNCADIELTVEDVMRAAPVVDCRVFQFAGTNLSREPSRSATIFAAERARASSARVVCDLDFRPDQWEDPRAFGTAIRSVLPLVDLVLGTEDEVKASILEDAGDVRVEHSQVSDARVQGDVERAIASLLEPGAEAVVVKRGQLGASVHLPGGDRIDAAGFPVEVQNVLGAGDAFAAGFLWGRLAERGWYESARLGNACGAIVVTKHGCANFMPTSEELAVFVEEHGGLE